MKTATVQSGTSVAGVSIYAKPCPKCGSGMFVKPCPGCFARRTGGVTCAKCINPKCRKMIIVKGKPAKGRKKR